jgi:hypothetical protein
MRIAFPLAALALLAAAPASATGTIFCRSQLRPDLQLYLVVGHGAEPAIAQVRLVDGTQVLVTDGAAGSPRLGQTWLDDFDLRLDIVDADHQVTIARLIAARRGPTGRYAGTMRYAGRTFSITCRSED